jgi:molybdopterin-dependent oxidoreductase alpha subunit
LKEEKEDSKPDLPAAENPEKLTGIKLAKPAITAVGAVAVWSSARHVLHEMNAVRGWKALSKLNQTDGHDCPGCAWPDPDDERSGVAEYCENGAKAIAEEATTKRLMADFFEKNSVDQLAGLSDFEIGKKGRLGEPVYLAPGSTHYQPISWSEAFSKIAGHLQQLNSPDEALFYTSGRTSNEAAFLYQLFVREYGTNNLPDCSNMCHESSGVALTESLGIGKGSVKLEDFYEAEVILILGQNPGTNHPRMMTALEKAKKNGCIIISVNPLKETGLLNFSNPQTLKGLLGWSTGLTDLYLQVKINGDLALLKAINLLLMKAERKNPGTVFDETFIATCTEGSDAYLQHLTTLNINDLSDACGVSLDQITEAASILAKKSRIIACWAMGLTQHKNAVDTIKEIVNLLLLKGSIGKPGAGTCPVRGHSNVQGDRTVGINEKPPAAFLDALEKNFGFKVPRKDGYDVVESIHAMHKGIARVFFGMGGNFLSATPDTGYTAAAIRNCDLTVQVSTKLNRSHLVHGKEAIILPCLGRTDRDIINNENQFVSVENSMGIVHASKGNLSPVSDQLKSEVSIVCELAKAVLGSRSKINWDKYLQHYDFIREDIERTIPGFEQYNQKIRKPGGFYLPNCNRVGTYYTYSGKAHFSVAQITAVQLQPGELLMMTIRSHDQFNTTIYGLNDRYRGVLNERRVIFMNKKDIVQRGFTGGTVVDIINNYEGTERVARKFIVVDYDIPEGCAATYFPETNVLVPINSRADKSNTPTSKTVVVKLRPSI